MAHLILKIQSDISKQTNRSDANWLREITKNRDLRNSSIFHIFKIVDKTHLAKSWLSSDQHSRHTRNIFALYFLRNIISPWRETKTPWAIEHHGTFRQVDFACEMHCLDYCFLAWPWHPRSSLHITLELAYVLAVGEPKLRDAHLEHLHWYH